MGDRVIITEKKGKPNIFTFRSTASNILHKFKSLPKPEDPEIQKLRVIETATKLIQSDIMAVETRKDKYPSAEFISTHKMLSLFARVFKNTTNEDLCW